MVLNMFLGMAGCLLPSLLRSLAGVARRAVARGPPSEGQEPLLSSEERDPDADEPAAEGALPVKLPVTGLRGLLVVSAPTVSSTRVVTPSFP